ncbi:hypothetical protein [Streptomyces sp. NBC_00557]|uniref:hypothetical protein n=1 Tax=Streptomyces sp. NBC_00557 TaxID=2975776 RepID=UPI002E8064B2|nr:hypothetical protein [Streptomyces sp. NBC_00557]WUC33670.1 hypothetical protein OG956_05315 [Streptomyces sp. NBC_00557]
MSASPAVRGLRAAVFSAVCVLLAAAGHGLAMGDMPPLWADAAAFAAVLALGWLLGGRERSLPGIGVAMLLVQAGLHLGFDAAHASSGHAGLPGMAAMPGHGGAIGAPATSLVSGHVMAPPMSGHVMASMSAMHLRMAAHASAHAHVTAYATAAHLLAALVASWWLWRGEAALWSLLRRAGTLVPGLVAWWRDTPLPAPAGAAPGVPAGPEPPRPTLLRHAVSRRGPPAPIPYSLCP